MRKKENDNPLLDFPNNFLAEPCSGDKAFAFIPRKKTKLALNNVRKTLAVQGAEIIAETPFVLIFVFNGFKLSLFKSGKLIVKISEKEKAKIIASRVFEIIAVRQ